MPSLSKLISLYNIWYPKFLRDHEIAFKNICMMREKFLQPKNFFHLCQNSFLYTTFDIQSFWKNYKIGIKNFCMVRENFCMLQKFAPLILQPRKTPLLCHSWHSKCKCGHILKKMSDVQLLIYLSHMRFLQYLCNFRFCNGCWGWTYNRCYSLMFFNFFLLRCVKSQPNIFQNS